MGIGNLRNKALRAIYAKMITKHYNDFYGGICDKSIQKMKKSGEDQWIEKWSILGYKANPIYYRLFSEYCGKDINIVPEDVCRIAIETAMNPERFRGFYSDKNSWDLFFGDDIFPSTVFRCMDGVLLDSKYKVLNEEEALGLLDDGKKYAIKPTIDTNSSKGFHSINCNSGNIMCAGRSIKSIGDLKEIEGENFIVQPFMKQHKNLSQFCSTNVNPIRITTYRSVKDEAIHVLDGGVLRIGFEGEENDGTHGNGKFVGIERNGTLKHEVLDYKGNIAHQFNGVDFMNGEYAIPNFDEVKHVAIKVAEKVLHARLCAFDIMLDENCVPIVFEFNIISYSMWLAQFTGTPAFGEYTDEMIEYTKRNYRNSKKVLLY